MQRLKMCCGPCSVVEGLDDFCQVNLDAEWQEVNQVFSDVMRVVEEARQKALRPLEDRSARKTSSNNKLRGYLQNLSTALFFFRKNRVKKEEEALIQKLQVEIDKIRKIANELDKSQGGLEVRPKPCSRTSSQQAFLFCSPNIQDP